MIKFYNINTEAFVPISHEKSYLFNFYDKLSNFLAINISSQYKLKHFLAKPVKNNYEIDFYSIYNGLVFSEDLQPDEKDKVLTKYRDIIDIINKKIEELEYSKDDNKKDWAKLLKLVFNYKNNLVYSNGNDICIIWGWKFENNSNYKPVVLPPVPPSVGPPIVDTPETEEPTEPTEPDPTEKPIVEPPETEEPVEEPDLESTEETKDETTETEIEIEEEPIDEAKNTSFLEFLKWFASKYWWFLIVLLVLIAIVFFLKSL
jgi:hypothetical protein